MPVLIDPRARTHRTIATTPGRGAQRDGGATWKHTVPHVRQLERSSQGHRILDTAQGLVLYLRAVAKRDLYCCHNSIGSIEKDEQYVITETMRLLDDAWRSRPDRRL